VATLATPQGAFLRASNLAVYRCPSGFEVLIQPREGHLEAANGGAAYGSSYCFNSGMKWGTGPNPTQYFASSLASRNPGRAGPFSVNSSTRMAQIRDGSGCTILVAEAEQDDRYTNPATCCLNDGSVNQRRHAMWMEGDHHAMRSTEFPPFASIGQCVQMWKPAQWTECNYTFGSPHTGILHAAMCDGAVRTVSENIDPLTWKRLGAMCDGSVVGDF
jgi:hypothetical protein